MPKQYMVELAQDERDELEAVLKSSTRRAVSATKLQRARIFLLVVSRIFCNFQWERRPAHMGGSPLGAKFSGVSCRLLPCLGFRFGCANHADPAI